MSSRRPANAPPREFSAGGVVVRGDELVVIVPTRRAADGSRVLALPKGHVDPGETPLQAAEREVREETGVVAEPVCELGQARYWYRREGQTIGKTVSFYLFRYVEGDTEDHVRGLLGSVAQEAGHNSILRPRGVCHIGLRGT